VFDLLTNDFVQNAKKLHDEFLDGNCGGGDPNGLNWEFPSAVFFVITIVTTIGYGTFAPTTPGGKAFTVIFAFIGIAYFGVVVGMVGNTVVHLIQKTAKCCCHRKEKKYKLSGKKTLLWTILMMCIYIALIGLGAHAAAQWDIGDAMYFSLITFTTIGLGDYAPTFDGDKSLAYQFVGYFGFGLGTMVGLSLLTTVLAGVQDSLEDYQKKMAKKLKAAGGSKGSSGSGDAAPRKSGGILKIMGGGAINMDDDEQIEKDNAEEETKQNAEEKKKKQLEDDNIMVGKENEALRNKLAEYLVHIKALEAQLDDHIERSTRRNTSAFDELFEITNE
jgi:hypothetical protein